MLLYTALIFWKRVVYKYFYKSIKYNREKEEAGKLLQLEFIFSVPEI